MAVNTVTGYTNAVFSPIIYQTLFEASIAPMLLWRDYEGEAKRGKTVHITSPDSVTIGTYTPGTNISLQALAASTQDLVIDQYKYWAFGLDRVEELWTVPKTAALHIPVAGKALGENIDTAVWAYMQTNAGLDIDGSDAPTAGAGGTGIILVAGDPSSAKEMNPLQVLAAAQQELDTQKVPNDGQRVFCMSPKFKQALVTSKIIAETAHVALSTQALKSGNVAQLMGFRLAMSTLLPIATNIRKNLAFHPSACAFAGVNEETKVVERELQFGVAVKSLFVYGRKMLDANRCCEVLTDES